MEEKYYKCTLLTDIVLNSKLATEGNMTTLDYIPGSNFLGIVAGEIYDSLRPEEAYDIFHSGKVSFGDALISAEDKYSYAMPFGLFTDKTENKIDRDPVWLHHLLDFKENPPRNSQNEKSQTKQLRSGYLTSDEKYIKGPEKNFALKSAHSRHERRSKEGAMFGFESLSEGQEFIFSLKYETGSYIEKVETALLGNKRLGKSKTAEYGQVRIESINPPAKPGAADKTTYTLVYAESNLCFLNRFGQATLQPTAEDLGLTSGEICWEKSQIRTYSYSPWNSKRNTPDAQRDCILKGSVFYVEKAKAGLSANQVGQYRAEGLGRVIYNPWFLEGDPDPEKQGVWAVRLEEVSPLRQRDNVTGSQETALGQFLKKKLGEKNRELELSKSVHTFVYGKSDPRKQLSGVTPTQWGNIRQEAVNARNLQNLLVKLLYSKSLKDDVKRYFKKENNPFATALDNGIKELNIEQGILLKGISAGKIWDESGGRRRKVLLEIIMENHSLGKEFVAKFAAEMAKQNQK